MLKWYWKVRIYNDLDDYGIGQFETGRDLREIDVIKDFYFTLTGRKMLLEGMSETPFHGVNSINNVFELIWKRRNV